MEVIANLWWLWLVMLLASGGYTVYNQTNRVRGMIGSGGVEELLGDPMAAFNRAKQAMTSGLGWMTVATVVTVGSGILLAISVIINVVNYLK